MLERMTTTAYQKTWLVGQGGTVLGELTPAVAATLVDELRTYIAANKEPCGECYLKPNETCDICGITNTTK